MQCMVPLKAVFILKNVVQDAQIDARRHLSRSHACSFVKNVVQSACVYHQAQMETSSLVLATTTGKPREEGLNVLEIFIILQATSTSMAYIYIYHYSNTAMNLFWLERSTCTSCSCLLHPFLLLIEPVESTTFLLR